MKIFTKNMDDIEINQKSLKILRKTQIKKKRRKSNNTHIEIYIYNLVFINNMKNLKIHLILKCDLYFVLKNDICIIIFLFYNIYNLV